MSLSKLWRRLTKRRDDTPRPEWGAFDGEVQTAWLRHRGPDRLMRLLADFSFVDRNGRRWTAFAGLLFDGASIPRFLWSIEGSPFDGDYRESAVIHDQMCKDGRAGVSPLSSAAVHGLFRESMLAAGLSHAKANRMYVGVLIFGPRFAAGAYEA